MVRKKMDTTWYLCRRTSQSPKLNVLSLISSKQKKKVLRRIMWPSKCCRCVTESQRWQTSYNATNQNLYSPLHHATHNKINVNLCGLSAQTSLARQKDKKRLMQIIHNWVSTQQAGLGTNVLQVNVSIDVTQWDTGCVLVGRRVGGAS